MPAGEQGAPCMAARKKAMRLLEVMDRSEKGLAEKLYQAGFDEAEVLNALEYVKSFGYLDDLRYAQVYIRSRLQVKSRQQLALELYKKGIDRETFDQAYEKETLYESPDEEAMLDALIEKKLAGQKALNEKSLRRLYGYLARRGFSSCGIMAALSRLERKEQKEETF